MKIFIDPGHGGHDSGAVGNGLREKDLTLDISLRQLKLFTKLGHEVKISRTKDVFVSLSQRVNQANAWGADIFISNHINAGGGEGIEVWHSIFGGKGKEYAANIEKELSKTINSRGLKSKRGRSGDYLYVIRATKMPAILNEFGFIDNLRDTSKLKYSNFRQKLAESVVRGVTGQTIVTSKENKNTNNHKYTVNYCLQWQKWYNAVTQTRASIKEDNIYGRNTQASLDKLLVYIKQSRKYKYCLEFQKFYNRVTQTRKPISEDGYWGPKTEKAYDIMVKLVKDEY